jgi:hypothetical protein
MSDVAGGDDALDARFLAARNNADGWRRRLEYTGGVLQPAEVVLADLDAVRRLFAPPVSLDVLLVACALLRRFLDATEDALVLEAGAKGEGLAEPSPEPLGFDFGSPDEPEPADSTTQMLAALLKELPGLVEICAPEGNHGARIEQLTNAYVRAHAIDTTLAVKIRRALDAELDAHYPEFDPDAV